jgi:hypothetical protein
LRTRIYSQRYLDGDQCRTIEVGTQVLHSHEEPVVCKFTGIDKVELLQVSQRIREEGKQEPCGQERLLFSILDRCTL